MEIRQLGGSTKFSGGDDTVNEFITTGFTNSENITVTYDKDARTVTLNGTFVAYYEGVVVSQLVDGWVSDPHDSTEGIYFLHYCDNGFTFTTEPWEFNCLQIAFILYDGQQFGIRECHAFMQWECHKELHQTVGTYKTQGGILTPYSYALNSTTATDRRPDVDATHVSDEDLSTVNSALTSKAYTIKYLDGANATRVFDLDQTEIIPVNGNIPYYNQYTGGAWQQTPMANNEYGAIFLVAIPTTADTWSQKYRYIWVQPQQVSSTLSTIQALTPTSLNNGDPALLASEFVFITKIIIKVSGNDWTIHQVDNITGTRLGQVASPSGSYLSSVAVDATLEGNGTVVNPLGIKSTRTTQIDGDLYRMYLNNPVKRIPMPDYGFGYTITRITVRCYADDPTTELNANIMYCDQQTTGVFPSTNQVLVDAIDTTTGNFDSGVISETVPTNHELYLLMDANVDYNVNWNIVIYYTVLTA